MKHYTYFTKLSKQIETSNPNAENVDLSEAKSVQVSETDNHKEHLQAHRNLKRVLFNKHIRKSFGADKALAILEKHIKEHETLYHELGKDLHRIAGAELPEVTFDEWMGQ